MVYHYCKSNTFLTPWLANVDTNHSIGIIWIILMSEGPHNAKFLTEEERVVSVIRVACNMQGIKGHEWKNYQAWHVIKDPKTWFLVAFVFFSMLLNGGWTNFGSLVISGLGFGAFETLLVGLPSLVISAGSMVVWAYFSTRHEGLRTRQRKVNQDGYIIIYIICQRGIPYFPFLDAVYRLWVNGLVC